MAVSPPGLAARSQALNARYGLSTPNPVPKPGRPAARPAPAPVASSHPATAIDPRLTQANTIVDASLDPQKAEVSRQIAAAEASRAATARSGALIAKVLGEMGAGDAEAARAAYSHAGDSVAGYARGFTGSLAAGQNDAATQAATMIHAMGAPGSVTTHSGDNADVSYLLGGTMPAGSLQAQAADALVNTQDHRIAGGLRVADNASQADFRAQGEIGGIRQKLLDLEAQRPGMLSKVMDDLAQRANAERATAVQTGYLQLQTAKSLWDQALGLTNVTGTVHQVVGKGKNAHIVDTGRTAGGSDAAKVTAQAVAAANSNATSRANNAASTATSAANAALSAQTRTDIANTAAAATKAAASTRADATKAAAKTAADAKRAAASVSAQAKKNQPATAAQKSKILAGVAKTSNDVMKTTTDHIWAMTPGSASKDPKEHQRAVSEYRKRVAENYPTLVIRVDRAITPQLLLLGYSREEIKAYAISLVGTQVTAPTGG